MTGKERIREIKKGLQEVKKIIEGTKCEAYRDTKAVLDCLLESLSGDEIGEHPGSKNGETDFAE